MTAPNLYKCKEWFSEKLGVGYMLSAHQYAKENNVSIGRARRILRRELKRGKLEIVIRNDANKREECGLKS